MNRIVEGSSVLENIAANLDMEFSFNYNIQRAEPSFFMELGSSYDEFLKNRSANFRYRLNSASKKMHSMGVVTFSRNDNYSDFGELYSVILAIEEKSWKHKHGTAITSSEKQREFYRVLCSRAFNKGWLRVCFLQLDQKPIAFDFGLLKGGRYYCVHSSFDEGYKKGNPGTVLLARFIEDLIRDGIKEYDWFGEPFEFQSRWTDEYRWHKSLLIYNHTPKARLFFIFNTIKDKLIHNVMEQVVLRNPRDIKPGKN
jgi:CelD/BcsL family acetyltransferase involved in cellulose biosynthesis